MSAFNMHLLGKCDRQDKPVFYSISQTMKTLWKWKYFAW